MQDKQCKKGGLYCWINKQWERYGVRAEEGDVTRDNRLRMQLDLPDDAAFAGLDDTDAREVLRRAYAHADYVGAPANGMARALLASTVVEHAKCLMDKTDTLWESWRDTMQSELNDDVGRQALPTADDVCASAAHAIDSVDRSCDSEVHPPGPGHHNPDAFPELDRQEVPSEYKDKVADDQKQDDQKQDDQEQDDQSSEPEWESSSEEESTGRHLCTNRTLGATEHAPSASVRDPGNFVLRAHQVDPGNFVPRAPQGDSGNFVPRVPQGDPGKFVPRAPQGDPGVISAPPLPKPVWYTKMVHREPVAAGPTGP